MGEAATKRVERPSPLTGLARSGIALGAAAVFATRELLEGRRSELWWVALIVAAAVALLAGISGLFVTYTTKFVADAEEFRVERRFLSASSQRVDYTKIQAVEISQPLVARLLGLAKVHIDVGGAGGVDLAFLRLPRAEEMRRLLLSRTPATPRPADPGPGTLEPADPAEEEVVKMSSATLAIGILISTNAASSLAVALLVLLVAWWTGSPVAVLGAALGALGWVWSQIGGNWGFAMTRGRDGLRMTRGLASRNTQALRPERVQGVLVSQDLLQRLTGLHRMHVTVLGFGAEIQDANQATNSLVLPFGSRADVDRVLDAIWPGSDLATIPPHPPPRRARWLLPLSYPNTAWGIDDEFLVARAGWLRTRFTAVPHRRMQSLGLTQGPLQRRLRLATLEVHTTDGPVDLRIRHLDEGAARALFEDQLARARNARAAAGQTPTPGE